MANHLPSTLRGGGGEGGPPYNGLYGGGRGGGGRARGTPYNGLYGEAPKEVPFSGFRCKKG